MKYHYFTDNENILYKIDLYDDKLFIEIIGKLITPGIRTGWRQISNNKIIWESGSFLLGTREKWFSGDFVKFCDKLILNRTFL